MADLLSTGIRRMRADMPRVARHGASEAAVATGVRSCRMARFSSSPRHRPAARYLPGTGDVAFRNAKDTAAALVLDVEVQPYEDGRGAGSVLISFQHVARNIDLGRDLRLGSW